MTLNGELALLQPAQPADRFTRSPGHLGDCLVRKDKSAVRFLQLRQPAGKAIDVAYGTLSDEMVDAFTPPQLPESVD